MSERPPASGVGGVRLPTLLLAFSVLTLPSLAAGDLLVTRDGERIETRGPWREEGKLVLFTLPNGSLASMRLSEVDLEASREATAAAARPAAEKEASPRTERRKPVFVLTDADVSHVAPSPPGAEEGSEGPAAEESEVQSAVSVISWEQVESADEEGVVISGRLRNSGTVAAADLTLDAVLYDQEGKVQETAVATLGAKALAPGQTTSFRVQFPGVVEFAGIRYEAAYQALGIQTAPPPPEAVRPGVRSEPE